MTKFFYKAKDWNGKLVKGSVELPNKKDVVESIRSNGLILLSITQEKDTLITELNKRFLGRVGMKEVSSFTRQLSTMMISGLPLTDALSLLKNQTERGTMMFEITDYALTNVQGGKSLGSSLSKYNEIFGEAYIASINAGEEGGVLEEVLLKLADNLEKENEFRGKVKGAMIYPVIVIIGMVIVAFIMMAFVIPKLLGLYNDFGAKLPATTQVLMTVSNLTAKLWFLFPIAIFAIFAIFKVGNQNENFRLKRDTIKLKIPIIGELTRKNIVANSIRTMSMMLSAGIPLVDTLKIVANVADNELYRRAFIKIAERVQKGFSISNSFDETGVFPTVVTQMVETGEATGKLDEVLMKVSDYFATEAEQSVKTLTTAIEPLIMIVLGVGVGFLVISIIMPIYNLTSQM